MSPLNEVRTSLEVGFAGGVLPDELIRFRGRVTRVLGNVAAFPYEDAQFDVVLMDGEAVSRTSVREAHRVLRSEGSLRFTVPERTNKQSGFTLPELYSMMRDGFNLVEVSRPPWWLFGRKGRTLSICARKKNWKTLSNTYRPYL